MEVQCSLICSHAAFDKVVRFLSEQQLSKLRHRMILLGLCNDQVWRHLCVAVKMVKHRTSPFLFCKANMKTNSIHFDNAGDIAYLHWQNSLRVCNV